ncbi:MAG: replication initiation factor domain-containing protein [Flavobacteriaceae bacterium]|nr:replication initiation factor domain-containing protein [Flavobacteriaceae bacterium]
MLDTVKQGVNVPARYNGDLLDGGYSLGTDYLILNLTGDPITDTQDGLTIDLAEYGTKVYKHRATLTYKGHAFGTMVFKPRSNVIDEKFVQLQLENHLFYTVEPRELYTMTTEILDILGLDYVGVNRLDIALDFSEKQHDIPELLKGIFNGDFLISGREKDVNVYTKTKKGQIEFTGVQIGKRSSSRFCRIYDKSREMQTGTLKPYISSLWETLGLDGKIWRYEYQLSNKYLSEIEGLTLESLFDREFIFNLLQKASENHFEIKHNTGKSEVNKEETYNFVDFEKVGRFVGLAKKAIGRLVRNIKETFIGQQRMIKGLLRSYFATNHDVRFLLPVRRILNDFDLWDWYDRKISQYIHEFKYREMIKCIDLSRYESDFELEC